MSDAERAAARERVRMLTLRSSRYVWRHDDGDERPMVVDSGSYMRLRRRDR